MFIVLTVVFLALAVGFGIWCACEGGFESSMGLGMLALLFSLCCIGCFIALMVFIPKVANENVYDVRIEIVEEHNAQLEEQICSAVEKYLEHEENVYEKLDVTTAIGLFSAYPNLKSNELVQSLIDTYRANTDEIKALKMDKVNLAVIKFLVYFGH